MMGMRPESTTATVIAFGLTRNTDEPGSATWIRDSPFRGPASRGSAPDVKQCQRDAEVARQRVDSSSPVAAFRPQPGHRRQLHQPLQRKSRRPAKLSSLLPPAASLTPGMLMRVRVGGQKAVSRLLVPSEADVRTLQTHPAKTAPQYPSHAANANARRRRVKTAVPCGDA